MLNIFYLKRFYIRRYILNNLRICGQYFTIKRFFLSSRNSLVMSRKKIIFVLSCLLMSSIVRVNWFRVIEEYLGFAKRFIANWLSLYSIVVYMRLCI